MKSPFIMILTLAIAGLGVSTVEAAKIKPKYITGATKVTADVEPTLDSGYLTDAAIKELAKNLQADMKKYPGSSSRGIASEDLLSPELKMFRQQLLGEADLPKEMSPRVPRLVLHDGPEYYKFLQHYDALVDGYFAKMKADPNAAVPLDLMFTMTRLATMLPYRGIIWRMTKIVHSAISAQEILLAGIRNATEIMTIQIPESHVQAQLAFFVMPHPELRKETFPQFETEEQVLSFIAGPVYKAMQKAVARLESIKTMEQTINGKKTPAYFDMKIRLGAGAFINDIDYGSADRYKRMGEAERFATLARYHRRMALIANLAAVKWNGHLKLRKDIGKLYGVDVQKSAASEFVKDSLIGQIFGGVPAEDALIAGVTREERMKVINRPEYKDLYTLKGNTGRNWMRISYFHLHKDYYYLNQVWGVWSGTTMDSDCVLRETGKAQPDMDGLAQLDPEVFMARKDQVNEGLKNMCLLLGKIEPEVEQRMANPADPKVGPILISGTKFGDIAEIKSVQEVHGSISGKTANVSVKNFYYNPPKDMKSLMPVAPFAKHEDLTDILAAYNKSYGVQVSHRDVIEVTMPPQLPGQKAEKGFFRNYYYGRAKNWNDAAYTGVDGLFPGSKSVQDAYQVIYETRGAKFLVAALTRFIR